MSDPRRDEDSFASFATVVEALLAAFDARSDACDACDGLGTIDCPDVGDKGHPSTGCAKYNCDGAGFPCDECGGSGVVAS